MVKEEKLITNENTVENSINDSKRSINLNDNDLLELIKKTGISKCNGVIIKDGVQYIIQGDYSTPIRNK